MRSYRELPAGLLPGDRRLPHVPSHTYWQMYMLKAKRKEIAGLEHQLIEAFEARLAKIFGWVPTDNDIIHVYRTGKLPCVED